MTVNGSPYSASGLLSTYGFCAAATAGRKATAARSSLNRLDFIMGEAVVRPATQRRT
jgi:hypothetical protein